MKRASRPTISAGGLAALLLCFLALPPLRAEAQTIEESVSTLGPLNGELYISPLTSGLAAALNTGFYHTAEVHETLGFDVGIRVMASFVPADADTFVPVLPETFEFGGLVFQDPYGPSPGANLSSPTVTGEGPGLVLVPQGAFRDSLVALGENPADFQIPLPDGFDIPLVPYGAVQGAVGVPLGTEVVVRFIPSIEPDEDLGSIRMFGAAIKHSLDQWFPRPSLVNVAIAFGFQHFKVGDYLSASSTQWSLIGSTRLSALTLFGAVALEDADLDISYDLSPVVALDGVPAGATQVEFTTDSPNEVTLKLGATLILAGIGLEAEYTIGAWDALTAGLLFSFR